MKNKYNLSFPKIQKFVYAKTCYHWSFYSRVVEYDNAGSGAAIFVPIRNRRKKILICHDVK